MERRSHARGPRCRYLKPDDPDSVYLGTVHRLDRPVSGVILWAKTPKSGATVGGSVRGASERGRSTGRSSRETPTPLEDVGEWNDWLTDPDRAGVAHASRPKGQGHARPVPDFGRGRVAVAGAPRLAPPLAGNGADASASCSGGVPRADDPGRPDLWLRSPLSSRDRLACRGLQVRHPVLGTAINLLAPVPATWAEQGIVLPETPFSAH